MTAVEFLIEQICGEHTDAWKEEIQQALELEKKQIEYAYMIGIISELEMEASKQAEQYYDRTYKKP